MTNLRDLERQATPGKWLYGWPDGSGRVGTEFGREEYGAILIAAPHRYMGMDYVVASGHDDYGLPHGVAKDADAALIAALRNAAPLLLDVVDAARAFYMRGSPDGQESDRLEIALGDALAALDAHLESQP